MSPMSPKNRRGGGVLLLGSSFRGFRVSRKLMAAAPAILLVVCLLAPCIISAQVAANAREAGWLFLNDGSPAGTSQAHILALGPVPIANAGMDANVTPNTVIVLNASASVPSDGATIVNYTWVITYKAGKTTHYGLEIRFWGNNTGLYAADLTVRDSNNLNATDTVFVLVKEPPKTFIEKYWLMILLGAVIVAVPAYSVAKAVGNVLSGQPVISEASSEKFRLTMARGRKLSGQLFRNPMGVLGVSILTFFVLMAVFGPVLAPYPVDLASTDQLNAYRLPSKDHWLGTDNFGIDIFSELLEGARTSMIVGIFSAVIASFLGAAVGLYSGYVGGWKDEVVMRLNDIVLSIPWLVLMIIVAAFIGAIDLTGIILIIGLTGWSTTARMVRAQVLSIRERQYVERARAIGSSDMSIIRRHVFPNTFPLVFANTILTVAVSILSEATLSFLGLRPAGVVTWGTMLSFASDSNAFQIGLQWWILAPGFCIVAVVLGFTLLGYALDELLNPKLRHR